MCGPGAFVVLKALAFSLRGENKDAYDLFDLLQHFGSGVADVASPLRNLRDAESTGRALAILRRDFWEQDGVGPVAVAQFLFQRPDDEIQADVVGLVRDLSAEVQGTPGS